MPLPPKSYTDVAGFPEAITVIPIGVVRSPHRERFGTPRQATLAADPALRPVETTTIELFPNVLSAEATHDLKGFETIWVLTWLHLNQGYRNKVPVPPIEDDDPPRRGLLATRAPHRPNPIGLSALRLVDVRGLELVVERCDLLDGTPVLDVKPYVPYADAFPESHAGWAQGRLPKG